MNDEGLKIDTQQRKKEVETRNVIFFLVQNFFQHFSKKNLCGVERIDDDDEEAKEQQVGKKC